VFSDGALVGRACSGACSGDDDCPDDDDSDAPADCAVGHCALVCYRTAECPRGATCIGFYCAHEGDA
jgi:hypothetical protein